MEHIRYYPDDNEQKSKKLRDLIEEDFRRINKNHHKKLKIELNLMNERGATYVYNKIKEETSYPHKNKTFVELDDNFYELRVPKQSKKGVFRVYFTIYPDNDNILILDAEYKTEREAKRLESARNKLEILKRECDWI